jgi:hypothetical protein
LFNRNSLGVTTGASKLQWRLHARDGSLVFLQTEYKLVANHQNQDTIIARNEVLEFVLSIQNSFHIMLFSLAQYNEHNSRNYKQLGDINVQLILKEIVHHLN